ncbi:mitochondrial 54S ribosomal protein YmL35 [Coemansia sp. RSA 989]|nr:phosphatidylethanolamine-binding protein [Coemansia mojavensis]KAJ1743543.1 mitochondrial 54S ribosomal protein YmL35 [Coemansia sp. RSA 1086]KAJ1753830.1 mitochondrial 54S ribosomal protein YmL35 [Coemansia sp. RSA 1821]KAJ1867600.1 mitochondrial 54S ribosomal protein YmL35 [Coemansia sp. RSA 989]KAJ1875865.1 mitochondrial 54S ribosomal protein YmL35 [Coemansia sp. RSA 990]KAJ2676896.1 mitochondrial 54S ribosomal protein YmL35 [Coemansia sp. RSA 1085]
MHAVSRALALKTSLRRVATLQTGARFQSTYKKPATGVNPAYDEALKVIEAYSAKKAAEADAAAAELKRAQESQADAKVISELKQKWFQLAAESRINDGEVLWNARQGNYDLTQPVYQHLKQQAWRGRPLEILMQRLLQMFVLPDMLDPRAFGIPDAQLNIALPESGVIEPGSIVDPSNVREKPEIELVNFHDEPRLHTIVMLDLDEPYEAEQTFREQFHWVVTNVAFSKLRPKADIASGTELLPYIPPHPAHGTPKHRYVVVALEQGSDGQEQMGEVQVSRDMTLRDFIKEHNLRPVSASFFRSSWNESVDEVYSDVLKMPSPRYGPMSKTPQHIGPDGREKYAYANY